MTALVELTGAGILVRDAAGRQIGGLTWCDGVGSGALLLLRAGAEPLEIPLDLDGLKHVRGVSESAHVNALVSAAVEGAEPRVPRRAPATDLPG